MSEPTQPEVPAAPAAVVTLTLSLRPFLKIEELEALHRMAQAEAVPVEVLVARGIAAILQPTPAAA